MIIMQISFINGYMNTPYFERISLIVIDCW
jgi:hypothetical protein